MNAKNITSQIRFQLADVGFSVSHRALGHVLPISLSPIAAYGRLLMPNSLLRGAAVGIMHSIRSRETERLQQ